MSTPRIATIEWGRIELVDGQAFKDAKIFPGGAREWDWAETGTRHNPGVQIADVEELVDQDADIVVLTRGQELVLKVPTETIAWLQERGITVVVDETVAAMKRFNAFAVTGARVGGLFHTTC